MIATEPQDDKTPKKSDPKPTEPIADPLARLVATEYGVSPENAAKLAKSIRHTADTLRHHRFSRLTTMLANPDIRQELDALTDKINREHTAADLLTRNYYFQFPGGVPYGFSSYDPLNPFPLDVEVYANPETCEASAAKNFAGSRAVFPAIIERQLWQFGSYPTRPPIDRIYMPGTGERVNA